MLSLQASGDLHLAVGDMDIFNAMDSKFVASVVTGMSNASFVVLDANVPLPSIIALCQEAANHRIPVWFEPTSTTKALKGLHPSVLPLLSFMAPNFHELRAMAAAMEVVIPHTADESDGTAILVEARALLAGLSAAFAAAHKGKVTPILIAKLGPHGVLVPADLVAVARKINGRWPRIIAGVNFLLFFFFVCFPHDDMIPCCMIPLTVFLSH